MPGLQARSPAFKYTFKLYKMIVFIYTHTHIYIHTNIYMHIYVQGGAKVDLQFVWKII